MTGVCWRADFLVTPLVFVVGVEFSIGVRVGLGLEMRSVSILCALLLLLDSKVHMDKG